MAYSQRWTETSGAISSRIRCNLRSLAWKHVCTAHPETVPERFRPAVETAPAIQSPTPQPEPKKGTEREDKAVKNENDKTGLPVSPSVTPEGPQGTGQWTPGPWNNVDDSMITTTDGRYTIVTEMNTELMGPGRLPDRQITANANLIAAAPELYDALADVVKMFRAFPLLQGMNRAKVAAIEAVLAKARGEAAPAIQSPTPQQESKKGTQGGQ